jgi:hypothetical protein
MVNETETCNGTWRAAASGKCPVTTESCIKILSNWLNEAKDSFVLRQLISRHYVGQARSAARSPLRLPRGGSIEALAPFLDGSIEALAPFVNLASDNDFVLVVAWLFGALRAGGPIRSWLSPGNKDRRRPSSPSSCGR